MNKKFSWGKKLFSYFLVYSHSWKVVPFSPLFICCQQVSLSEFRKDRNFTKLFALLYDLTVCCRKATLNMSSCIFQQTDKNTITIKRIIITNVRKWPSPRTSELVSFIDILSSFLLRLLMVNWPACCGLLYIATQYNCGKSPVKPNRITSVWP